MRTWYFAIVHVLCVASSSSMAADSDRTDFERSFIGRSWVQSSIAFGTNVLSGQCKDEGGFSLQRNQQTPDEFGLYFLACDERRLILLGQSIGDNKVKVLDARLLPKLMQGERFMYTGDCEQDGKTDTDFIALVSLGRREKVDWKTGVRAAWLPNTETGKIELLSTRHIVCWRPTPP